MVSLTSIQTQLCTTGLNSEDSDRVLRALDFVDFLYSDNSVFTGQSTVEFSHGIASVLALLNADVETRIAALLLEISPLDTRYSNIIEIKFGREILDLVTSVQQLLHLHSSIFCSPKEATRGKNTVQQAANQVEILGKMLLAMATDIRAVLILLSSRVIVLRYFSEHKMESSYTSQYARETLDLYAPLANRLGIFQIKWELEDLSFRFIDAVTYKYIAKMLEERRIERENFISGAIALLQSELASAKVKALVSGRPKHIYSIWKKMQDKELNFSELYDVHAFRLVVKDVETCYTVLGIVHNIWPPIPQKLDDYISRPKKNSYQSLHTVVLAENERVLEVQIRTKEMHYFAEYGVAAHWRYKETGGSNFSTKKYDKKISWLRQLLAWKSEVVDVMIKNEDNRHRWLENLKKAALNDHVYVLTPQARVIELPNGATPIDFAYYLHTDIGHRCRGAKVDYNMVPLNTILRNGQTVEIITMKSTSTGPSRDWLTQGYSASARTRSKVRAWFNAIEQQETLAIGRTLLDKTLQREGKTTIKLEELARKLDFSKLEDLLLALGKDTFSLRYVEQALNNDSTTKSAKQEKALITRKISASNTIHGARSGILVAGTSGLKTQLAKCCKPAPPDFLFGFVTRGKGVSIHRESCRNFSEMRIEAPERVIQTTWGPSEPETVYPVDILLLASDRQGLILDISSVLLREKINIIYFNTEIDKEHVHISLTAEIFSTIQLQRALNLMYEVKGVLKAKRR